MPVEMVRAITEVIAETKTPLQFYPHFRSDPFDHPDFSAIIDALKGAKFDSIVTSVPRGKEDLFFQLFESGNITLRTTFGFMNEPRLTTHPDFEKFAAIFGLEKKSAVATAFVLSKEELSAIRAIDDCTANKIRLCFVGEPINRLNRIAPQQLIPLRPLLFAEDKGIYIAEWNGIPEMRFGDLLSLSKAIVSGRLQSHTPFLLEWWETKFGSDFESQMLLVRKGFREKRYLILRSWNIHPCAQIPGHLHPVFGRMDGETFGSPAILVQSDGSIHHVTYNGTVNYEQLHGPAF
jgi:hypothetical protein